MTDLIVERGKRHDFLVMGASKEVWFEKLIFGTIPEKVAKDSDKSVMLVKKYLGVKSWIRRWLGT